MDRSYLNVKNRRFLKTTWELPDLPIPSPMTPGYLDKKTIRLLLFVKKLRGTVTLQFEYIKNVCQIYVGWQTKKSGWDFFKTGPVKRQIICMLLLVLLFGHNILTLCRCIEGSEIRIIKWPLQFLTCVLLLLIEWWYISYQLLYLICIYLQILFHDLQPDSE